MIHINNIDLITSYIQNISDKCGLDVTYKIKIVKGCKFRFSYSRPVEGKGSTPVRDAISWLAYDIRCYLEFLDRKYIYAYISTRCTEDIRLMREIMPEFEILYRHEDASYSNSFIIRSKSFMTAACHHFDFPHVFNLPELKYNIGENVPYINKYFLTHTVAATIDDLLEHIQLYPGGKIIQGNKQALVRDIKLSQLLNG